MLPRALSALRAARCARPRAAVAALCSAESPPPPPQEQPLRREVDVAVDRSGLYQHAAVSSETPWRELSPLERHLSQLIRFRSGPLSVAEYMSEVLTHPTLGYYTGEGEVFGAAGDFVTSPDVSQVFGELLAVWTACLWRAAGAPPRMHLVELGPGRGTLAADLLRTVRSTPSLAPFASALRLHLVEVSPALRSAQARALGAPAPGASAAAAGSPPVPAARFGDTPVRWHAGLDSVPHDAPLLVLAHEFFDALPVHQFVRTDRGWCERLVDLAPPPAAADAESAPLFRWVLSAGPTLASRALVPRRLASLPPAAAASLASLEVCPRAQALWQQIAARVGAAGGGALAIDYGGEGPIADSLAAIRRHAFVDALSQVGSADLSAHVDFGALRAAAALSGSAAADGAPPAVRCLGPISQRALLASLGIEARVGALMRGARSEAEAEALAAGAERLVAEEGMGGQYQCLALVHAGAQEAPVGFEAAWEVASASGGRAES